MTIKIKNKISVIVPLYNNEAYVGEMLKSLQNQSFRDFEVIIIDDGSTDNSKNIACDFCKGDSRFKYFYQENSGVSAARNKGIEVSDSEYVVFYDSDDIIPNRALESLYRSAKEHQADLVVGAMSELYFDGRKKTSLHTQNLSKMKQIDKYDKNLIWSFSLANKMFKREIIEKNNMRFLNIRHTEDGVFVFNYIFNCQIIVGCRRQVYLYRRRSFFESKSTTQRVSVGLLNDFIYALDLIGEMAQKSIRKDKKALLEVPSIEVRSIEEQEAHMDDYLSSLYGRFISTSLINGFYRQIWNIKDDAAVCHMITDKIREYRKFVAAEEWKEIVLKHVDLDLERCLYNKKELRDNPRISFVLSSKIDTAEIDLIMKSLYNQKLPAFEIIISRELECLVKYYTDTYNNICFMEEMGTIGAFKQHALRFAKGKYISYIDENVFSDNDAIYKMYQILEDDSNIDFAVTKLDSFDADNPLICYEMLFSKNNNRNYFMYKFDCIFGNKLFRKKSLLDKEIVFTDDVSSDIKVINKRLKSKKIESARIYTTLKDEDIIRKSNSGINKLIYRIALRNIFQYRNKKRGKGKNRLDRIKHCIIERFRHSISIKNKVLFISVRSDKKLLDNSKALYDTVHGVKKVIIASKYPHSLITKIRIIWHLFSSKVIITDDYLKYLRLYNLEDEQKVIQIWHACGLFKRFGFDYHGNNLVREKALHKRYDYVTVSSEYLREGYASAFGIDVSKILPLGVPRTDALLDETYVENCRKSFYERNETLKNKKIVLFAPTFREKESKRIEYEPGINWKRLNDLLGEEAVFIIKKHPMVEYDFLKGESYDNIKYLDNENIYTIMMVSDLLVTDYSSVIFEYCLFDKPIVFYCPDYNEYVRDFYIKFPDDVPGVFTTEEDYLFNAIKSNLDSPYLDRIKEFRNHMMGACDGKSSERIARLVNDCLNSKL